MGTTIARNVWPARVSRDGTLHVATSSSSWAFELGQLQDDILRRLRAAAGAAAPATIRFAVGKLPERGPDDAAGSARAVSNPTTEQTRRAAELAASIEDDDLRDLVARAAAASLARGADDRPF